MPHQFSIYNYFQFHGDETRFSPTDGATRVLSRNFRAIIKAAILAWNIFNEWKTVYTEPGGGGIREKTEDVSSVTKTIGDTLNWETGKSMKGGEHHVELGPHRGH
ncbi:hypothetical protein, partial [Candidatus Solincola sp.]